MLKSVLIGLMLIGITVLIHSCGTTLLLRMFRRSGLPLWRRLGAAARPSIMVATAMTLLLLLIAEVLVWATAYWMLTGITHIHDFEEAMYFSAVTFSTLGYGDITLHGDWRLLCGLEAMSGILLSGWSTALLFLTAQYLWFGEWRSGAEHAGDQGTPNHQH